MPTVYNRKHADVPDDSVYVGRGSKWGNPFRIGPDGNRESVIKKYENWLAYQDNLLNSLNELRGRNLVCYCAPLQCHGDVLIRIANATDYEFAWWISMRRKD
jgi:Domain of unknown function (DUF4326)